jgi:hypothetical protein
MDGRIGEDVYIGRFLFVWAVFYLTFFLGSKQKIVQGILFAAAAIAGVTGTDVMLSGWVSWSAEQTFVPFSTRVWAWIALAALPAGDRGLSWTQGPAPACALRWCIPSRSPGAIEPGRSTITYGNNHYTYARQEPNLAAHALVAAFALFLCWWGVRMASKALVNLGIVGFAVTVAWFYFSDIWDKMNRSLGLIGLGVLVPRRRLGSGKDATAYPGRHG